MWDVSGSESLMFDCFVQCISLSSSVIKKHIFKSYENIPAYKSRTFYVTATVGTFCCRSYAFYICCLPPQFLVLAVCVRACVLVCVFVIQFSHQTLIYLPIGLLALGLLLRVSFSVPRSSPPCTWVCLSLSLCLSATVPVRLPTFCPFTCLLARRFVCSWSVSLCRSSFSVSVFHRLSEFLSFCKLLCLFLDSANTVSCVYACVRVTVCVCALS